MEWRSLRLTTARLVIGAVLAAGPAAAQQITGTPGAPDATESIAGRVLPPPAPTFGGQINLNAAQSATWWPPRIVPPEKPETGARSWRRTARR
jgi:arylsulfatase